jgi:hypothetical protein
MIESPFMSGFLIGGIVGVLGAVYVMGPYYRMMIEKTIEASGIQGHFDYKTVRYYSVSCFTGVRF